MLTKTDQLKSKDRASRQYPIDFVVPLQLEECVYRIEHSKQPIYLPEVSPFSVEIKLLEHATLDSVLYAVYFRSVHLLGTITSRQVSWLVEGSFNRWEGTSTKITGKVEQVIEENSKNKRQEEFFPTNLGIGFFVAIITISIIFILLTKPIQDSVVYSLILAIPALMSIVYMISQYNSSPEINPYSVEYIIKQALTPKD